MDSDQSRNSKRKTEYSEEGETEFVCATCNQVNQDSAWD